MTQPKNVPPKVIRKRNRAMFRLVMVVLDAGMLAAGVWFVARYGFGVTPHFMAVWVGCLLFRIGMPEESSLSWDRELDE